MEHILDFFDLEYMRVQTNSGGCSKYNFIEREWVDDTHAVATLFLDCKLRDTDENVEKLIAQNADTLRRNQTKLKKDEAEEVKRIAREQETGQAIARKPPPQMEDVMTDTRRQGLIDALYAPRVHT